MIQKMIHPQNAAPLFQGWEETIIWSCLQGIMGAVFAPDMETPDAAMAVLGDFRFFAGIPNQELVLYKQSSLILVPQNDGWAELIRHCFPDKAWQITRYAIKKEPQVFDREHLRQVLTALPDGYELRLIDEALYRRCLTEDWSRDLVSQFDSYERYRQLGLGAVILKDGEILSGASSYSRYREGIEIEIDTRPDQRRKGFACICGAKLILECLRRGLYPSWDAHTPASVALAEKLGYRCSHPYTAFEITYDTRNPIRHL